MEEIIDSQYDPRLKKAFCCESQCRRLPIRVCELAGRLSTSTMKKTTRCVVRLVCYLHFDITERA